MVAPLLARALGDAGRDRRRAQSISRPQRRVKPVGGGCRSADRAMRARRPIQPSSDRQRIVPLRAIGNVDRPSLPNLPISRAPRRHVRV